MSTYFLFRDEIRIFHEKKIKMVHQLIHIWFEHRPCHNFNGGLVFSEIEAKKQLRSSEHGFVNWGKRHIPLILFQIPDLISRLPSNPFVY